MSTRQSYDHELASLRQDILAMGEQVAIAIDGAVNSLKTQDIELARKVIDGDDAIDNAEVVIEDKCMLLIAKQQPLARDLRILIDGGYTLIKVTPIDQFLWSPHVEAVALLTKPKRRR